MYQGFALSDVASEVTIQVTWVINKTIISFI